MDKLEKLKSDFAKSIKGQVPKGKELWLQNIIIVVANQSFELGRHAGMELSQAIYDATGKLCYIPYDKIGG